MTKDINGGREEEAHGCLQPSPPLMPAQNAQLLQRSAQSGCWHFLPLWMYLYTLLHFLPSVSLPKAEGKALLSLISHHTSK